MNTEQFGDIIKITLPTPFPVGDVNVFLIKGDRLTLVDAGTKTAASFEALVSGLADIGYKVEDIEQVLLTHHHPDHTGLLDFLPRDIDRIGHPYCANWVVKDEAFLSSAMEFYRALFRESGGPAEAEPMLKRIQAPLKFSSGESPLTLEIKEGSPLPGLADWQVFEVPGHAQSHLAFYREKDGAMVGGDHVLAKISSNPLLEPPLNYGEERPKPLLQYNHSLKRVMGLPVDTIYTGHGAEVKNANALIASRFERQHDRAMFVKDMIEEQSLTAFDICVRLFPTVYKRELDLTMSETIGQLDYLLDIGAAGVEKNEQGVYSYFSW